MSKTCILFGFLLATTADLATAAPTMTGLTPASNATVRTLVTIEIFFNEEVTGVDAADLLINGTPATDLEFGLPGQFLFAFPQPAAGTVQVAWAANHGITDVTVAQTPFAGGSWTYTLDPNLPFADPILNEFLADNNNTLNDEDGDSSDWIEIHNPNASPIDIGGWFLTDNASALTQWRFPANTLIPANGYLVVFASGKDRTAITNRLHTNFQLGQNGEYLALVNTRTNVVSDFSPRPQQTDVSYGRDASDFTAVGYFATPTPGSRNQSRGSGLGPEVRFSRPSGTFVTNAPFNLTLTTSMTNAVIRYAFGTNVPGTNGLIYSAPLRITNTIMIRARAFVPGVLPGPVTTRAYIGLSTQSNVVNFSSHLPVMILHNYGRGAFPQDKTQEREVIVQTFEPGVGRSALTNTPTLAEFGIAHLRGSSTLGYAKGSFFLEIQDEFREGKPVELLGLPEEADWVMYAPNNFEPALFHNPLAHQLARDQGEYASRTRFVEVYLKDDTTVGPITSADYNGIYVLEEKIKRDKNRVDIATLEPQHTTISEVTGGYIFSIDRTAPGETQLNAGGAGLNWIYPDFNDITNTIRLPQVNYIRNYLNSFNSALGNSAIWTNPVTGYAAYIDVNSWVRRHVHEVLTHNIDALRLSGYLFKDRNKKIQYGPAWDYDRTQGSTDGRDFNPLTWRSISGDLGTDYFNFSPWWNRLFQAPDFWQAWIDKYQELRDGPLSMMNISNRIEQLAAQIRPAHARELARWNVPPRSGNQSRDNFSYNFGNSGYENEVRWKHFWYSNRLHFIDTQLLARPHLSFGGGQVSPGFSVTISPGSKPGSSVIYTLDGSDPRASGGSMAPGAFSNNAPVTITVSTNLRVFARSWHPTHANLTGANRPPISSRWSGPATATVFTRVPPLRITEIMYHPQNAPSEGFSDEDFEYIELRNVDDVLLNIDRYKLSGGVDFVFPNTVLAGGERVLLVRNRAAFEQRYGTSHRIVGEYTNVLSMVDGTRDTNSLDNAGERLVLEGRFGEPILDFEYDDDWYPITDGAGFSLVIANDQADPATWGLKSSWRPSGELNGSPGQQGSQGTFPQVVINEVLTHSDPPPPTDTIELRNLSATAANIGGWFLTDDFANPKKYRIADGTTIPANGYMTFNETQFNVGATAFSLSSLGEQVYLFSGDGTNLTGYVHGFDFGAAPTGATFGRYVTSTGGEQFPFESAASLSATNSGPLVGPVVISEINYHPADFVNTGQIIDNDFDEYIELHNITGTAVPLFDPVRPANTWRLRDGVDFDFPLDTSIPANGRILVVSFDPAETVKLDMFRARNNVAASVPIYGPFQGKLDNSSEAIELERPDVPEPLGPPNFGLVPYVLVERVRYADQAPWPLAADGIGASLQRLTASAYGNDPANWVGAARTPGAAYGGGAVPVVTTQPINKTVVAYTDSSLAAAASGSNLSYQWRFNGENLFGQTNATLNLTNIQASQQGTYQLVVLNPSGSTVSSNAFLTVLIPAAILTQPQGLVMRGSTNGATYGMTFSNGTFSVSSFSSTPMTYQWSFNGTTIPGATNTVLTVSNATLASEGTYDVLITDSVASVRSAPARLTVTVPVFVTRHPQPVTALAGENVTLSVDAVGTESIGYRWRRSGVSVFPGTGFNVLRLITLTNAQPSQSGIYDVIITNLGNATPGFRSSNALVTIMADVDNDKAGDAWETNFNFNLTLPDGLDDADGDGMKNWEEFRAGTDPTNALSYLKVDNISVAGSANISFMAMSNTTYVVEYRDGVGAGSWNVLGGVLGDPANRVVTVVDTNTTPRRFYRLVTPLRQE